MEGCIIFTRRINIYIYIFFFIIILLILILFFFYKRHVRSHEHEQAETRQKYFATREISSCYNNSRRLLSRLSLSMVISAGIIWFNLRGSSFPRIDEIRNIFVIVYSVQREIYHSSRIDGGIGMSRLFHSLNFLRPRPVRAIFTCMMQCTSPLSVVVNRIHSIDNRSSCTILIASTLIF